MIYYKAQRDTLKMPADSLYGFYGVIVPRTFSKEYNFDDENTDNFELLNEDLESYGLMGDEWKHDSEMNDIVIGKYIGEVEFNEGHPSSKVYSAIRNLSETEIAGKIKDFLESVGYSQAITLDLYFIPDCCRCCT